MYELRYPETYGDMREFTSKPILLDPSTLDPSRVRSEDGGSTWHSNAVQSVVDDQQTHKPMKSEDSTQKIIRNGKNKHGKSLKQGFNDLQDKQMSITRHFVKRVDGKVGLP